MTWATEQDQARILRSRISTNKRRWGLRITHDPSAANAGEGMRPLVSQFSSRACSWLWWPKAVSGLFIPICAFFASAFGETASHAMANPNQAPKREQQAPDFRGQ